MILDHSIFPIWFLDYCALFPQMRLREKMSNFNAMSFGWYRVLLVGMRTCFGSISDRFGGIYDTSLIDWQPLKHGFMLEHSISKAN
jgi:hypothetical protein